MFLGGAVAALFSWQVQHGVFVGALLSMSSTSVVIKCLEATKMSGTTYGQITLGTLILQDCTVGILFALMPVFGQGAVSAGGSTSWRLVFGCRRSARGAHQRKAAPHHGMR